MVVDGEISEGPSAGAHGVMLSREQGRRASVLEVARGNVIFSLVRAEQ